MRLDLSKAAQRDIDEMHAYGLKVFGRTVADDYSRQLLDLLDVLQENPRMGIVRAGFKAELRTLRYRSHLVFYRISQRGIRIQRILHGSQNWSVMF